MTDGMRGNRLDSWRDQSNLGHMTPSQKQRSITASENLSMKRLLSSATILLVLAFQPIIAQTPAPRGGGQGRGGGGTPPPITAKPEELAKIKEKTGEIEAL